MRRCADYCSSTVDSEDFLLNSYFILILSPLVTEFLSSELEAHIVCIMFVCGGLMQLIYYLLIMVKHANKHCLVSCTCAGYDSATLKQAVGTSLVASAVCGAEFVIPHCENTVTLCNNLIFTL